MCCCEYSFSYFSPIFLHVLIASLGVTFAPGNLFREVFLFPDFNVFGSGIFYLMGVFCHNVSFTVLESSLCSVNTSVCITLASVICICISRMSTSQKYVMSL